MRSNQMRTTFGATSDDRKELLLLYDTLAARPRICMYVCTTYDNPSRAGHGVLRCMHVPIEVASRTVFKRLRDHRERGQCLT